MSFWQYVTKQMDRKVFVFIVSLLLPFVLSPLAASPHQETKCSYVVILVACYWLLEPVSIAVTALLPIVLFPALDVVSSSDICTNYMKEAFMLFLGGLIMAVALEECRLHERIALRMLLLVGSDIKWIMMGFMLTTMFLSMWVSNTATTAMMVPIVDAVFKRIIPPIPKKVRLVRIAHAADSLVTESNYVDGDDEEIDVIENECEGDSTLKTALLLCICYSANIGGTGTLTGTGPNLVLVGLVENLHPESNEITFASWMVYNVPGMLLCILIAWFYLWMVYIKCSRSNLNLSSKQDIKDIISKRYAELGHITFHEAEVVVLFIILALLWVFRDPKIINGWLQALGTQKKIGDSAPAMAIGFLLFFLPSDIRNFKSRKILDWKTAQAKLPWGVIILLGGGFALADGAQKSGLSKLVGQHLLSLQVLSPSAIVAIVCFMTAMITEIVSNTTTATILLPVFSQLAISIGFNPLYIMLPATVVCSYAFMLPVATPPNAIAFDSGNMKTIEMAKPGFVMNIICCTVQIVMVNTIGVSLFDLKSFPSWANSSQNNNLPELLHSTFLNSTSTS